MAGACAISCLVALVLPGTTAARDLPVSRAESVGMSSDRLERIGPAMQRYIDAELVPGTVTAILRKGKLVLVPANRDIWQTNDFLHFTQYPILVIY